MSSQILKTPLPYLALILAHLIWGGNFVVAKITLQEFPPMSLAFIRFALASLFLAPFILTHNKKIKIDPKDLPKLIAVGVIMVTLHITFFYEGLRRTGAIDASILTMTIPIFSVLAGWWFLKEKILPINLMGVATGFAGAAVIILLPHLSSAQLNAHDLVGNILIILSAISWVIGAVLSKKLLAKYSTLTITAVVFLIGTITFFIPAALEYTQNPNWVNQITLLGIIGLVYITLLSSVSAFFLFEWGLYKTSVYRADLFQYLEPFVAASLAMLLLSEQISTYFLLGAGLTVLGAYLGTLQKAHRYHKAHRG